jgi:hypothetical protein
MGTTGRNLAWTEKELSLGYYGKGHTHTQYISLGRME